MTVRARIEAAFASWGRLVVRRRWLAILAILALSIGFVSSLPRLEVDNSFESFLLEDDPARRGYDRFREQFGRDDRLLLIIHPPEIFDLSFLEKLRAFHRDLETEVPYLEEITSLVNARATRGEADELIVEELVERWPTNGADLEALRERVLSNPLYINLLISESAAYTTVTLEPYTYSTLGPQEDVLGGFAGEAGAADRPAFLTQDESLELVEMVRQVVSRYEGPDFRIYMTGEPAFEYVAVKLMQRDLSILMTLSILVIAGLLFILFRRASGVVLPLVVVLSSTLSSLGIMAGLGIPWSIIITMIPVFLTVIGVCDAVHILVIVYQQLDQGQPPEEAIPYALGHAGLAVVMTSVTTACGLLSFSLARLGPIAQLGTIAPIGVMLAMVYSLVLLPALLAISPLKAGAGQEGLARRGALDRFLANIGDLVTRHPGRVLFGTAVLLVFALGGFLQLRFSHNANAWYPKEDPLRVATELFNREFKGASGIEVLIDTGRENGLHEPEALRRIERAMRHSEALEIAAHPVSKAVSIVDIVKETHQALNENRREFYVLPEKRELIAQELLLFENSGSEDLEKFTDSQFQIARMSVRTPWVDAMLYPDFIADLEESLGKTLGESLNFELTGALVLFGKIFTAIIVSMTRSYVFAFAVITPLMMLLIGSVRRGLLAMIPNLIPVYLVLSLMGWTGIPLDASTLLIGGIVIGIAVDDTIHFMHKFNRYYEESGDPRFAVHETLATTGTAMLFTSLVLSLGFAVFLAAYLNSTFWFGLLAGFACAVAFLADVIVAPALMMLVTRHQARADAKETLCEAVC
jgi:predicted RND superfamily exporter protein